MIVRAFAGSAEYKRNKDFLIARASLADRLTITPPGASDVIRKLCKLKVIDPTQAYVIQKESARFCWLLPRGKAKAQLPFVAEAYEGLTVQTCDSKPPEVERPTVIGKAAAVAEHLPVDGALQARENKPALRGVML